MNITREEAQKLHELHMAFYYQMLDVEMKQCTRITDADVFSYKLQNYVSFLSSLEIRNKTSFSSASSHDQTSSENSQESANPVRPGDGATKAKPKQQALIPSDPSSNSWLNLPKLHTFKPSKLSPW